APESLAGQARPLALYVAPILLPARGRCAAARALALPGPHAGRARVPPRGLPRPPPPRVVPAHVAQEPHLRGGGPRLPLVARHRRALVGAAAAHPAPGGTGGAFEGAPRETAREAPPPAPAAPERHPHEVP